MRINPNKNQWYNKHSRTRASLFTLSQEKVHYQEVNLPSRCCGLQYEFCHYQLFSA